MFRLAHGVRSPTDARPKACRLCRVREGVAPRLFQRQFQKCVTRRERSAIRALRNAPRLIHAAVLSDRDRASILTREGVDVAKLRTGSQTQPSPSREGVASTSQGSDEMPSLRPPHGLLGREPYPCWSGPSQAVGLDPGGRLWARGASRSTPRDRGPKSFGRLTGIRHPPRVPLMPHISRPGSAAQSPLNP